MNLNQTESRIYRSALYSSDINPHEVRIVNHPNSRVVTRLASDCESQNSIASKIVRNRLTSFISTSLV